MFHDPQRIYEAYQLDPAHDMHEYSPFLRESGAGVVLEIGVRGGVSTAAFLLSEAHSVISVDIDRGCSHLYEGHSKWTFITSNSLEHEYVKKFVPDRIDVLFIDGDHSYSGLTSDLNNYYQLVKPGGLILAHDVDPRPEYMPTPKQISQGWAGEYTRQAWKDFLGRHPEFQPYSHVLPGKFGLGVIEVPK